MLIDDLLNTFGDFKDETFLVSSIKEKPSVGGPFIAIGISDETGASLIVRRWNTTEKGLIELLGKSPVGHVCKFSGTVGVYKRAKTVIVNSIEITDIDPNSKLVSYPANVVSECIEYLKRYVKEIPDLRYRKLAWKSLIEDTGVMRSDFTRCVAGEKHHHNKVGGLVIHTAMVCRLVDIVTKSSGLDSLQISRLKFCAIMHDRMKPDEYNLISLKRDNDVYLDHQTLGATHVAELNAMMGNILDKQELNLCMKILMMHHGPYSKYTPRERESTPYEAKIIHACDLIDMSIFQMIRDCDDDDTRYIKSILNGVLNGEKLIPE